MTDESDEMREEYDFSEGVQGKYARDWNELVNRIAKDSLYVVNYLGDVEAVQVNIYLWEEFFPMAISFRRADEDKPAEPVTVDFERIKKQALESSIRQGFAPTIDIELKQDSGSKRFTVTSPNASGLITEAETVDELRRYLGEALKVLLDGIERHGLELPYALFGAKEAGRVWVRFEVEVGG